MKLISLNTWAGKTFEPLMEFIANEAPITDIFCLQEITRSTTKFKTSNGIRTNLYNEVSKLLPGFRGFFAADSEGVDLDGVVNFPLEIGQTTFIKSSLHTSNQGSFFTYGTKKDAAKTGLPGSVLIHTKIDFGNKMFVVCNFHGIPKPGHKLDTSERLEQSRRIKEFLDKESGAKILCGDFNLLPNTESLVILEKNMRNLVSEFQILRTRSRLSPFFGKPDFQKFADYVLVSPDAEVIRFEVSDIEISDHLPMILEFR